LSDDYWVITETNPNKAIDLMTMTEFDVIVVDLIMPTKSGIELTVISKHLRPSVPVLIVTGCDKETREVKEAILAGASGLIEKPFFDPSELKRYIDQFISKTLIKK
jgi:two-component system alkaline phosphatase synthesis response regulator PhoP